MCSEAKALNREMMISECMRKLTQPKYTYMSKYEMENILSQYFHPDPSSIVKAMSEALARVATGEPTGAEETQEHDAIMCLKLMPYLLNTLNTIRQVILFFAKFHFIKQ